jgi:hypothetical protein
MSDTRAAIRELRSLSEKRSLSALSEPEAARWMALRRQLGLPLEPETLLDAAPAPAATARQTAPAPAAAPSPEPAPADVGAPPDTDEPSAAHAWDATQAATTSEEASEEASPDEAPPVSTEWAGPSLDSPTSPVTSAWVGPALDAPAWSDAAADRPTDPELDGPPPAPFDEAPAAARPAQRDEVSEFGGSPEDRVPLAAAADFVSYGREGNEAIDLPAESGTAEDFEQQSLAQLTSPPSSELVQTEEGPPREATPREPEPPEPEDFGAGEGILPEPPREMEASPYAAPAPAIEDVAHPQPPREMEPLPYGALGTEDVAFPEPPREFEPLPYDALGTQEAGLPEAPRELEAAPYEALGADAPSLPEPARELEAAPYEALGADAPSLPEPARELEAVPYEALGADAPSLPEPARELESPPAEPLHAEGALPAEPPLEPESAAWHANEGVLPEPPYAVEPPEGEVGMFEAVLPEGPLELGAPETALPAEERVFPGTPPPLQLGTPLSHVLDSDRLQGAYSGLAGAPTEPPPPLASTWAPGSEEPPLLATDDFGRTGDPLGGRGLDPWPEGLSQPSADEVVETVGDDDFVEDLPAPTPEPPRPLVMPSGSGGIRGFQFPKPPPGPGPVLSTPAPWQRTEPGVPPFAASAVAPASTPLARLSPPATAPSPQPASAVPSAAVDVPVAPAPPSRSVTPTAVAPQTPPPTTPPWKPLPPAAVAPAPPEPTSRPSRPAIPVSRPTTAASLPRTPVPAAARAAPSLPPAGEEELVQPVLELVDEVEPAAPTVPQRSRPTPSPATGTPAVFGPPMMLNPSIVEGDHRVVVHTLEGQVHRGTVHDLDLQDDALAVQQPDGRSVQIPTKRVKAVFFVLAPGGKPLATRGERVQVTFRDGRQVVGYSDDHATGEPGFFVVPSDARTNTARVYVFRGGVQSITTG